MLLMEANRLEQYWGDRLIYKMEGSLHMYRGDRLGIVGRNGAGKTTLLETLAGLLQPDAGTVKLYGECAVAGAFEEWEKEPALSGGEKTRRKLEAAFQARTPILIADEPTSHMDLEGIRRVEKELDRYDGLVVLVSHDRELLNTVCTHILEVEEGRQALYTGGYASYRKQKELKEERNRYEYGQFAKEKERIMTAIRPGEKVALIGPNGAGKSTLLDMIRSGAAGTAVSGGGGEIGFFHQSLAMLEDGQSVLARLHFRREEVLKPVGVLSGGEKVKAELAKVFLSGCNIMLLDEPTNYLDVFAREELEEVLAGYPGTILFASHDRWLITRVADKLLLFDGGQVRLFDGAYPEYLRKEPASDNRDFSSGRE